MKCFADRPATLDDLFTSAARRFPDGEALVAGSDRLSYRDLDVRVSLVASGIRSLGLKDGQRVAFALGNRIEFVEMLLACARIGVVAVPLNIRMRHREILHALRDSGATAIVFETALTDQIPPVSETPACRIRIVVGDGNGESLAYQAAFSDRELSNFVATPAAEEAVSAIVYTSGTTGKPKGASITQIGFIHSAMSFERVAELKQGDRSVVAVPASHITGMAAVIYPVLHVGGCLVLMPEFRAADFVDLAVAEKCTYAFLVPAMVNLVLMKVDLSGRDLTAWRLVAFGGAPMPPATIDAIAATLPRLKLLHAYGATETTAAVTATMVPSDSSRLRQQSIGRALPCAEIRIMDEIGREVLAGRSGELWIGGPSVIASYWGNPQGSEDSLRGGFWRSGDVGWVDDDGYVFIGDRKKDMINRAGFKIYSTEVEAVLMNHPLVDFAAVVGRPDPVLGEKSHAFVVGSIGSELETIRDYCATQLSDYKIPDAFTVIDGEDLPRNASGKVLKAALRERLLAEQPNVKA
ncbi:class I adenylate-forming enzyme family protein [Bradyrhizobium sp. Ash2021]|uniref:class I adenylate-forming enzyme family protein n=1 Tax=Bradyrhizobium sp. Ash2021 TaxID=2954771 RepID=UPI002814FEEC|nr:class I adenylate-forming enzyme family protein [Bradyrhizobium sp. Ash2021]WMT76322.1 acyl--CoA ligase [Bradyrhizobium sp. Ash2021]